MKCPGVSAEHLHRPTNLNVSFRNHLMFGRGSTSVPSVGGQVLQRLISEEERCWKNVFRTKYQALMLSYFIEIIKLISGIKAFIKKSLHCTVNHFIPRPPIYYLCYSVHFNLVIDFYLIFLNSFHLNHSPPQLSWIKHLFYCVQLLNDLSIYMYICHIMCI